MFPSMEDAPDSLGLFRATRVWIAVAWISLAVLFWDWAISLPRERRHTRRSKERSGRILAGSRWYWTITPGRGASRAVFLANRYLTIFQVLLATLVISLSSRSGCELGRALPYGFTVVSFSAHLAMTLRVFAISSRSYPTLISLAVMAIVDLGIECTFNGFLQPVFVSIPLEGGAVATACLYSTSSPLLFALIFISASVFQHIVLGLTLWASWKHFSKERMPGRSIMTTLRRHQVCYVLTICLVNFGGVISILLASDAYKLVSYIPAQALTSIFLGRIFFALREAADSPALPTLDQADASTSPSWVRPKVGPHPPTSAFDRASFLSVPGRIRLPFSPPTFSRRGNDSTSRSDPPTTSRPDTVEIHLPIHHAAFHPPNEHEMTRISVDMVRSTSQVSGYGDATSESHPADDHAKAEGELVAGSISTLDKGRIDGFACRATNPDGSTAGAAGTSRPRRRVVLLPDASPFEPEDRGRRAARRGRGHLYPLPSSPNSFTSFLLLDPPHRLPFQESAPSSPSPRHPYLLLLAHRRHPTLPSTLRTHQLSGIFRSRRSTLSSSPPPVQHGTAVRQPHRARPEQERIRVVDRSSRLGLPLLPRRTQLGRPPPAPPARRWPVGGHPARRPAVAGGGRPHAQGGENPQEVVEEERVRRTG